MNIEQHQSQVQSSKRLSDTRVFRKHCFRSNGGNIQFAFETTPQLVLNSQNTCNCILPTVLPITPRHPSYPCLLGGPEGIPCRVFRACADQLARVFTNYFNQSLSQSAVPTCFKRATIVPVPKKAKITELNDYRS